ncbi:hypothetical protein [Pontibacterium sp.]
MIIFAGAQKQNSADKSLCNMTSAAIVVDSAEVAAAQKIVFDTLWGLL